MSANKIESVEKDVDPGAAGMGRMLGRDDSIAAVKVVAVVVVVVVVGRKAKEGRWGKRVFEGEKG